MSVQSLPFDPTLTYAAGGIIPPHGIEGRVTFDNVHFHYPSRPDAEVGKTYDPQWLRMQIGLVSQEPVSSLPHLEQFICDCQPAHAGR